jgi:cysteine sulfinate desulfinase/cysteine desulfurase-like protein
MSNNEKPGVNPDPVVFLHGFGDDALMAVVRAIKAAAAEAGMDADSIAFTASTPTNLEWKLKALIREVRKEHAHFHPPQE